MNKKEMIYTSSKEEFNFEYYVEIKKIMEQAKKLKLLISKYFDFDIPEYILEDIIEENSYTQICLTINVAILNQRITEENAKILKRKLKELFRIKNIYDEMHIDVFLESEKINEKFLL